MYDHEITDKTLTIVAVGAKRENPGGHLFLSAPLCRRVMHSGPHAESEVQLNRSLTQPGQIGLPARQAEGRVGG